MALKQRARLRRKRAGAQTIVRADGTSYERNAKHRDEGRGSVYFDKSKRSPWIAQLPPLDGRIEKRRFREKGAAEAWLEDQMALRGKGVVARKNETLGWWLDHWFRTAVARHKKPKTAELYGYLIRTHIQGTSLADLPLASVKPQHLREFYEAASAKRRSSRSKRPCLQEEGDRPTLSRSTVLNLHAVLSGAFAQAVDDRKIEHNPASAARPPRPERKRIEALTPEETDAVLASIAEHRLADVVEFCLECGLRVGEALGLTWDRVHIDSRTPWAMIDRQLQLLGREWVLDEPKRRSVRKVGLSGRAREILQRARDRQRFELKLLEQAIREAHDRGEPQLARWGWTWNQSKRLAEPTVWRGKEPTLEESLVFTARLGGPIHRSTVTHTLQRELRRAGVSNLVAERLGRALTTHHMRHQHASELLAAGAPISDVRDQLGHKETATTLDMYGHAVPGAPARLAGIRDAQREIGPRRKEQDPTLFAV
jgi:integrase